MHYAVVAVVLLPLQMAHQEEGISVEQHVLWRDGSRQAGRALLHKVCSILCGDVLHDNLQVRHTLHDRLQLLLDEYLFPVKEVDAGVSDLSMYEQEQPCLHDSN